MSGSPLGRVVQCLRQTALRREMAGLGDGPLLERFVVSGEAAAFEALVRRHGPMVLGVCRRVLRHSHDAEDAFQATFLVLARRAASVSPRERVGPFLYGVACRVARKAQSVAARRHLRERPLEEPIQPPGRPDSDRAELLACLDDAIRRLPEKYRLPLVLCALEGASRCEAARQLGVSEGTLSSRLARARRMLARRLSAYGLALPASLPAALSLSHPMTDALVVSTIEAIRAPAAPIATLAQGVIPTMFVARIKIATVVLAVLAATGLGTSLLGRRGPGEDLAAAATATTAVADKPKTEAGPTIPATMQSVDAGRRTLTALVQKEKGKKERAEKSFDLARDVRIVLVHGLIKETKAGALTDLTEGTSVSLQLSPDEKTVLRVEIHGGSLHGGVKAVDGEKNTLTVLTKTKDGAVEKTVELIKGARVLLDDGLVKGGAREGKLSDLTEGTPVFVQLSGYDRKSAVGVVAHGPTVHGTLKGVDASANTITVTVKENATVEDRTYDLAKGVKANGGRVTDITAGTFVTLQLSVFDKKTVVAVHSRKD